MTIAGLVLLLAAPARAVSPSAVGDVTITEFQADPAVVSQYYGEWFELYNNAGETLDLDGVTITNAAGRSITVAGTTFVAAGDYLVFGVGQNRDPDSATYNGNVPVDVVYTFGTDASGFNMDLSADSLTVAYAGVTLDTVAWTSAWPTATNYAHAASLNAYDQEWANDFAVNWCSSATFISDSRGMYGSPGAANEHCGDNAGSDNDGDGWSEREGDCRDDDATIHPGALDGNDGVAESAGGGGDANDDADCDGLRDDGVTDDDGDSYSEADGACDDADGAVSPGAAERADGIDNDCDGCLDDLDSDGDGFGYSEAERCGDDCSPSLATSADPTLAVDADPNVYPGAPELPYDGYDQDCDGADLCDVDADSYEDARCGTCGDACDCDDEDGAVNPSASEVEDDRVDNDCDGAIDIPDRDGDGVTVEGGDCMDLDDPALVETSARVYPAHDDVPAATEVCGDLLDNDCDGFYDNLPECANPASYARVRGGGLCGVSPAAGGSGALALGALAALMAATRRRDGDAR
jgi:hypothetical protein